VLAGLLLGRLAAAAGEELRLSVYGTAHDVHQHLGTPAGRQRVLETLAPLQVGRLFLEGRRGDAAVAPDALRALRAFFATNRIHCSGGIAPVPGRQFGTRQTGGLDWLDWGSSKTRADVARFFSDNAPVFDEIIVDDFLCTGDTSATAQQARGTRAWGDYRRDLLVSLLAPLMREPTRAANPRTRLLLKFPQWYDRFHLFGYDPPRMAARFDQVWVGTEVRNPATPRMGYVQPTSGYMNFRWLAAVAGDKVYGAWFDHIECSAQNFVDQAYGSVLAGAGELTLFHLGDLMAGHPGDALLAQRLPELRALSARLRGKPRRGIPFYKPPGSESAENMYLADYLGMIGLPLLPVADYPGAAAVAFLPVQAAADPGLLEKIERHLARGATLMMTPALVRALGPAATRLAGVETGTASRPATARAVVISGQPCALEAPLELDTALQTRAAAVQVTATGPDGPVPLLTRHLVERGVVWVLNVRTFSEQDFGDTGEWLLAPRRLGLPTIPQPLAEAFRDPLLAPLGVAFHAPCGVLLVLLPGDEACLYSFREEDVRVRLGHQTVDLPAHGCVWATAGAGAGRASGR